VSKEMYSFVDQGENGVTLRPEGTAGIMRALISGPSLRLPARLFYSGPMFRYERPQRGRLRQFTQIGVEIVGDDHFLFDVEGIQLAAHILSELKVSKHLTLEVNSLGDAETRIAYRKVLAAYLNYHKDKLSEESQARLARGSVLRVLDSKAPADKFIVEGAPHLLDHLTPPSKQRFDQVLQGLKSVGLPGGFEVVVNPRLVRGLDYYCHTIFEFVGIGRGEYGKAVGQTTVLAGGRYDGLSGLLGSKTEIPGFGWAAGVERLSLIVPDELVTQPIRPVCIVVIPANATKPQTPSDSSLENEPPPPSSASQPSTPASSNKPLMDKAFHISNSIRQLGIPVILGSYDGSLSVSKQMAKASRAGVSVAIFVGEAELQSGEVGVKNLDSEVQEWIKLDNLQTKLQEIYGLPNKIPR